VWPLLEAPTRPDSNVHANLAVGAVLLGAEVDVAVDVAVGGVGVVMATVHLEQTDAKGAILT
jgi:hypothetical protein